MDSIGLILGGIVVLIVIVLLRLVRKLFSVPVTEDDVLDILSVNIWTKRANVRLYLEQRKRISTESWRRIRPQDVDKLLR
jgi:hypothetical protein